MEGNTESLNVQSTYIKSIPRNKKGRRKSDTLLEKPDRNCPDIFKNTDEEINKEGNSILNNRDEPQINGYNRKEKNNENKLMCEKSDELVSLESQLNCDNTEKNFVKTILNGSAMSPASSTDEEIFQTRFLVQNESFVHENDYFSDTSHTSSKKNLDKDNVEENDSHKKRKSPIIIQAIACDENKFGGAVSNNLLPSTINEKETNHCQEVIGTVKQSDSSLNVELKNSNFDVDSHYMRNLNYNENELLDIGNIKSVTETLSKEEAKCLIKDDKSDWTNLHFDGSNGKLNDSIVDDFFSGTLDVNSYQGVKSLRNRKTTPLSEKKTNKSSYKERKKVFDNKKHLDISNVKNAIKTFPGEESKSTATKNVSSWSDSHFDKLSDNLDFISKDVLNDTFGVNSYQAVKSPRNMKTIPLSREKTKNKSFNKEQKNIFDDKNDSKEKYDLCNINREKLTNGEKDFFESLHTTESRNVKRKNSRESQMRETKRAKRIQIKQNTDDADKKIDISRKFTFEANTNNVKNQLYQSDKHSALNKGTRKNASMIKTNNIENRYKEKMCDEISTNSNIDKYRRHRRNSSRIASEKIKHIEELEQFGTDEEINLDSDNSTKSDTNDISKHKNKDTKLKDSSANTKYTYKNNLKNNIFWSKNILEDISSDKVQSCSTNKDKMNSCRKNIVTSLKNTFDKCSKRPKRYDEDISNEISVNSDIDKNKRHRRNSSRIASEKIKQIEELEQFDTCEEIDLDFDNGTKSETNDIDIYTNIDTILKDSSAKTKYAYKIENNKKSNSFWNKNVSEDIYFDNARSCSDNKDKMNNCHNKIVKSLNKTFDKCSKRDKSYDEDISNDISVNSNIDKYKRHRQNSSRIASEKIKQIEELEQFEAYEEIDLGSDNGTNSETNDIDIYTNIDTILKDSSTEAKYTYKIKNNLKSNSFWNKNVSEDISSDKSQSYSDNEDKINNSYKRIVTPLNKTFDKRSKRDRSYDEDDMNNEMNKTDRGCIKKDQTVKNVRLIFNKKKIQEDTAENKTIIPFNKTLSQTAKKTWDMLEKELLGESEDIYTAKNANRNVIPKTEEMRNQNLQNAERLSLASTAAIQRPMNIVERTIAAMGRCTATLFDTKQRINENEKEDSSLFEEVFGNPDISQETQFHSEITFVAKNNKHYYKNEIFGFVKKSTRRKNTNNISENHKNSIYSTCTNNTHNKYNKYIEPSKFEESNSKYCTTKNNSKEKSNTIQAVVLSHPIQHVNPWDRLMNNLQLENDNMQKDFSSNNWKKDSFEPVYNKHLSKYSNHSDEEVANDCDEVNTIDLENDEEEWKLKDFQTLSDTEQELAESHLTASRNSTLNANNFVHTDSEGDTDAFTSSINYRRGNIKNQSEKVQSQKEELNKVNKLKKSPQINITDDAKGLKLKEIPNNSCTTNHSKKLLQLKEKNEIDLSQLKQKNAMEFAQSKQNHELNSNDKTKNKNKREKYKEYLRKQLNRTQLSHRMEDSHRNLIPMTVENKNNGGISENKLENKRNVKRKLIAENDEDVFSVSSSDSEDDKVKSQCTGIFSDLFDK